MLDFPLKRVDQQTILADFMSGRPIKIKIYNFGENIGGDFQFFCHFYCIKKFFPNVYLDMCRSNLGESNCIGFGDWQDRVKIPLDRMVEVEVLQWYPDGENWIQKLQKGDMEIIPRLERDIAGYDYVWGIGWGGNKVWLEQFRRNKPDLIFLEAHDISAVIRQYTLTYNKGYASLSPIHIEGFDPSNLQLWGRNILEYLCYKESDYPIQFLKINPLLDSYKGYLRVSLRWPDFTRWYYPIDKQWGVLFNIVQEIKRRGKPANILFSLKDFELLNTFNQGILWGDMKYLQGLADDIVWTYSWTSTPRASRPSEYQERTRMQDYGLMKTLRLSIWEDLYLCDIAKVYLGEPAGMSEVVYMTRKDKNGTFLFPCVSHHANAFTTLDPEKRLLQLKVNPLTAQQIFQCSPTMSEKSDGKGVQKLVSWDLSYNGVGLKMGPEWMGDDWGFFNSPEVKDLHKTWADMTSSAIIEAVVDYYCKE